MYNVNHKHGKMLSQERARSQSNCDKAFRAQQREAMQQAQDAVPRQLPYTNNYYTAMARLFGGSPEDY